MAVITFAAAARQFAHLRDMDMVTIQLPEGATFTEDVRDSVEQVVNVARANGAVILYRETVKGNGLVVWERVQITGTALVVRWLFGELDIIYGNV